MLPCDNLLRSTFLPSSTWPPAFYWNPSPPHNLPCVPLCASQVIDFGELIDVNGWQLTIAKGIDPILMIALISVKDNIADFPIIM